jgi:CO/xanthine dehydrogenase Mo-binding subunit
MSVDKPKYRQVGKPLPRVDALGKAIGRTTYAGDYTMPNMLHAKVLRSKHPSARVKRIDVSRARELPGVAAVITADELPGGKLATDMPGQTGQKRTVHTDAPVLAKDVVRYVGEPLALIAAETEAIAEKARDLIEVEYEPLPGVFDPLEAMKPGAPIVQPPDNVVARWRIRKGDLQAGMDMADLIIENTYRMPFIDHAYIEPEVGLAWVDDNGVVNIRVSTQVVEHFRSIAMALGVPHSKLHIIGAMIGGGFGGKEDITVEIYTGLLALATRRPVRLVYTREESLVAHAKRHPFIITHRVGVRRNGRITAAEIKMVCDGGAYVYLTPYVSLYATIAASGPYRIDNLHVDTFAVATNNPLTSAFRCFGSAQACFAYEGQMDEIAKALGLDPLEVRRINYVHTGDATSTGQRIKSAVLLEESARKAWEALGERTPDSGPVKIGRGVASHMQSYGRITWFHDTSQSWVGIEMDGSVVVRCGVPDLGGGQMSSLCQIAAEVLGVPMAEVSIYGTDSALTPLAGTTTATRQLYMSGNATYKAAGEVRRTLLQRAALHFEVPPEELDLADKKVFVKGDPQQSMPLAELVAMCAADGLHLSNLAIFQAPFSAKLTGDLVEGDIFPDFTFGSQAVEVAVDTETGQVRLLRCVGCHDIGQAINPAAVEGQIEGGSAMGIGYALLEEVQVKEGQVITPSLAEYLLPTACDVPDIKAIILESGTGVGPFGAKGIGEPALTPVAPAIANAVADAIGARVFSLPITPEKVLAAIDALKG